MMLSMTGFGRSQANLSGLDVSIEISSVNRRNLEVSVSLPREWQPLERDISNLLRERLQRGKVHLVIQTAAPGAATGFFWDEQGLESSLERLGKAAARHGIEWPPGADALIRLAALNKVDTVLPDAAAIAAGLLGQVGLAAEQLLEMRRAEGASLEADLRQRAELLSGMLVDIRGLSAGTPARYRDVLLQRLAQAGLELELSDERVLKELSIYADRADISEELTRLESHLVQFRECLDAGSPVGRKLEFILQEVNREFNTIGSKANNIDVSRLVIEAKNEIERIREQIQNIE